MAIDIFGEWATIIGQILALISIAMLTIQTARWAGKRHLSRDWYFFVLTIMVIVSMEAFGIYRFDAQQTKLSSIEEQNRLLNLQTIKLQNQTVTNQNLLIANEALIIAGLNTTNQNKDTLITDSSVINIPGMSALQNKGLLHQILEDIQQGQWSKTDPIDNNNRTKNILNMTHTEDMSKFRNLIQGEYRTKNILK